jgi:excisionase family DNA binding protein
MTRHSYVRIGEAARLAGVSVDTLRRWDEQGLLRAVRSFGGQRTYLLSEVEQLRDDPEPEVREEPEEVRPRPAPLTPLPVQPWKAREANAAADLSVTRLAIERREEVRRYREEAENRVAAAEAQAAARMAAAEAQATARKAEARLTARLEAEQTRQEQLLNSCIQSIRVRLIFAEADARAEVERFLADHAAPGRSIEWIRAEAQAIIDRRRAEQDALEAQDQEAVRRRVEAEAGARANDLRRSLLVEHGARHVREMTSDRDEWDPEVAGDAIEEVKERLVEIIESSWTESRVEREVREMLAEWD